MYLVIAIAANKADLYEHEEVDEGEGRNFAEVNGAIFRYTSAKNSSGIEELFESIGNKLLDPQQTKAEPKSGKKEPNVILYNDKDKKKEKKEGCC
jgi:50S ribosomal subunit-associated GTPase HflX